MVPGGKVHGQLSCNYKSQKLMTYNIFLDILKRWNNKEYLLFCTLFINSVYLRNVIIARYQMTKYKLNIKATFVEDNECINVNETFIEYILISFFI